jgi:hypothetical protein
VRVVADAEPSTDPVADHRTRPNACGEAYALRTGFDDANQFVALIFREPRSSARRDTCPKTINTECVVPLQPAIHRAASDTQLVAERDYAATLDIAKDGLGSPPLVEITRRLGLTQQLLEPRAFSSRPATRSDCFASLRARHDRLLFGRDRVTLILRRSNVNVGSQPS